MHKILVTGGAGYIGSHTTVELINAGYEVVVVDNFCNSCREVMVRLEKITGKTISLYAVDVRQERALEDVFAREKPDAVIHFASLKAVGESLQIPLEYYYNNICGAIALLRVMQKTGCRRLVFSSSATVYGDPHKVPITEDFPLSVTNPYGRTKLIIEDILRDCAKADKDWSFVILRYFNPVGAHASGLIGEDPQYPNNLMPYISQVCVGRRPHLNVFGSDYNTPDGTGVRDYIHVVDLAQGHVAALKQLCCVRPEAEAGGNCRTYNLGTGTGVSVLELVNAMVAASQRACPVQMVPRRAGDVAQCYADASLAERELGWRALRNLQQMCEDTWRWQVNNPNGFTPTPN